MLSLLRWIHSSLQSESVRPYPQVFRIMRALFLLCMLCVMCSTGSTSFAADARDPLFDSVDVLEITLNGPFARIDDERDKDQEYPGTLSYLDDTGEQVILDLDLSVRGNWRLRKANCSYSQLWLDLKRSQTPGTLFENQNRLKLVVQCRGRDNFAGFVEKEYLGYKIFEELSEFNYDTRFLQVNYIDTEEEGNNRSNVAFFIEHQNRLAEKFNMEEVELNAVFYGEINSLQASIVGLFMFMIGNTDFSIAQAQEGDECCHNVKLLVKEPREYFPIPYDFDSSGFVEASYAAPPSFDIRNSRERLFRGYCAHRESIADAIAVFMNSRDEIEEIIGGSRHLNDRGIRRSQGFIDDFYDVIGNEQQIERQIFDKCRG